MQDGVWDPHSKILGNFRINVRDVYCVILPKFSEIAGNSIMALFLIWSVSLNGSYEGAFPKMFSAVWRRNCMFIGSQIIRKMHNCNLQVVWISSAIKPSIIELGCRTPPSRKAKISMFLFFVCPSRFWMVKFVNAIWSLSRFNLETVLMSLHKGRLQVYTRSQIGLSGAAT